MGIQALSVQPFIGEEGGKGALAEACSLGPRSPHFHFSRCQPPSQAAKGTPAEFYPFPLGPRTRADKKYRNDGISKKRRGRAEFYPNGTFGGWGWGEGERSFWQKELERMS